MWDAVGPDGKECRRCGLVVSLTEESRPVATTAAAAAPGPDWYFPRSFSAKRAAEKLCEETHFAVGGGQLYVYRDGCYRPDGGAYVRTRTTELFDDRWLRRYADEVDAFLIAQSRQLWERPPTQTISVRNGLLEIATGKLLKHSPDFLSPVQLGASYDAAATCPAIDRFVSEVFPPDARELAFDLAGHLMIPDTTLERAVMLIGGGGNGKSTYLTVLQEFLGAGNVSAVTLQSLDANRFAPASLYGKLANIVADLDAEAVKSSSVFKAVVSGDPIQAERKYGTPFTYRPFARLLFSANEPPPTHDSSYAYFRRWIIVPFENPFAGERKVKGLAARLTTPAELSGLLNRALAGVQQLAARGDFTEAASLQLAKDEFRTAVDSAAAFVAEDCVIHPDLRAGRPDFYRAYGEWCERVNRMRLSARRFNERVLTLLPNSEAAVITINGTEHWQGIALAIDAPDLPAPPPIIVATPPEEDTDKAEGGERVEKVEELSTPLLPGQGTREERVGRTATFSTQHPPNAVHRCPGCGLPMSVVRVSDLCGRCKL